VVKINIIHYIGLKSQIRQRGMHTFSPKVDGGLDKFSEKLSILFLSVEIIILLDLIQRSELLHLKDIVRSFLRS